MEAYKPLKHLKSQRRRSRDDLEWYRADNEIAFWEIEEFVTKPTTDVKLLRNIEDLELRKKYLGASFEAEHALEIMSRNFKSLSRKDVQATASSWNGDDNQGQAQEDLCVEVTPGDTGGSSSRGSAGASLRRP